MPTITAGGTPQTIALPEGKVLLLKGAAGTVGVAYRLDQALGGTNSLQSWAVRSGALDPLGPYEGMSKFLITCTVGSIDMAIREAVLYVGGAPATAPGQPAKPVLTAMANAVSVAWTAAPAGSTATLATEYTDVNGTATQLITNPQIIAAAPGVSTTGTVRARNAHGYGPASAQADAVVPSAAPSINFVAMLDSLTAALGATDPSINAWPVVAKSLLPSSAITVRNVAVSGDSTTKALERWDSSGAGFAYDPAKGLNVLGCLGGTNDAPLVNLVPIYRRLREIYRRARVIGYDRVIAFTIPSRDDATASYSADTLPLNIAIRELFDSDMGADALADLAADPRMSTIAAVADGTFYSSDRLHFVDAGYAGIGHDVAPVLANVIAAPGARKMAPPTWSAFDASKYLSISNSGRTLTWAATGFSNAMARAYCGAASGKYAWETVLDDVSQTIYVGMCNSAFEASIWDDVASLIENVNAIGYSGADVRYNNAVVATLGAPVTGDVIQHAVDLTARRYWIRKAGGQWNGSANADPFTGAGGIDISALGAGMLYPAGGIFSQGGQITSRFAASQMTLVPSGFVAFG